MSKIFQNTPNQCMGFAPGVNPIEELIHTKSSL